MLQVDQNRDWAIEKAEDSGYMDVQQVADVVQDHRDEEHVFVEEAQDTKARPELLPRYSQVMRS